MIDCPLSGLADPVHMWSRICSITSANATASADPGSHLWHGAVTNQLALRGIGHGCTAQDGNDYGSSTCTGADGCAAHQVAEPAGAAAGVAYVMSIVLSSPSVDPSTLAPQVWPLRTRCTTDSFTSNG